MKSAIALLSLVVLAGCQTDVTYVRNASGPVGEYAMARQHCEMMSAQSGTSVVAIGSPAFVAGAMVGGAVSGAMSQNAAMHNCMMMNGWTGITRQTQERAAKAVKRGQAIYRKAKAAGQYFPPAPKG